MKNKKLTTYQKLKVERQQYLQDIEVLVRRPNSIEGIRLKMKYKMWFDQDDIIWSGRSSYIGGIGNNKENLTVIGNGK